MGISEHQTHLTPASFTEELTLVGHTKKFRSGDNLSVRSWDHPGSPLHLQLQQQQSPIFSLQHQPSPIYTDIVFKEPRALLRDHNAERWVSRRAVTASCFSQPFLLYFHQRESWLCPFPGPGFPHRPRQRERLGKKKVAEIFHFKASGKMNRYVDTQGSEEHRMRKPGI